MNIAELYFCTNTSSNFVKAITKNPKANVYFYSRTLFVYQGCMLRGDMEIVTDLAVKEKYWDNKYKNAYTEKSYSDPDFCVLKFTPKNGRLYRNFSIDNFEF